jgi:hypothetical protein
MEADDDDINNIDLVCIYDFDLVFYIPEEE